MAAGLGFKDFVTGEVLTAADVDGYLMQGVWVFASAAARSSAVTSPQEGNYSFLKDTNSTEYYDGAAWVAVGAGGATFVGAKAFLSSDLNVSTATNTTVNWGSESFDTDAIHSTSSNTSRFTVPTGKGGKWTMVVNCNYSTENATGQRSIRINKNGTFTDRVVYQAVSGGSSVLEYVGIFNLVATDYLEVVLYQESGSTLTALSGADGSTATFYYLGA